MEQIDANRMNEYLGYMKTCIEVYYSRRHISIQEYGRFMAMVESLQGLNSKMEDFESNERIRSCMANERHDIEIDEEKNTFSCKTCKYEVFIH